ncbi:hypothetical protein [Bradyrhizobium sp. STM 3557]|uniref:hypothetical protein n=1 Tax=Bradyrhizobium sp. STM 3557 TaxID=578920 RepID=UPI00388DEAE7
MADQSTAPSSHDEDWEPVHQQPQDEDWEPVHPLDRPIDPSALEFPAPQEIPEAFVARLQAGRAVSRIMQAAIAGAKEGAGTGTPTGFEDATLNYLIEKGVFHDPASGRPGPLQLANEALMMPAAQLWQGINRALSGGLHGAGGAMEQLVSEFGGSQGSAAMARRDIISLGEWAMIEGGMGRFSRPSVDGAVVLDKTVGSLPTQQDFALAGKVLDSPHAEPNLRRIWSEDGIHPAEAVHDAERDAFLKHEITAPSLVVKSPMEGEEGQLLAADGAPMSLSAARTDPTELPSPDVQPVRPGLAAQASKAVEDWNGLATNIQYLLDPMATGSKRAIVPAKDAVNSVRRIRWDHARIDADLVKKFDAEALDNMWRAADEESVARQTGDIANENIGLSRLDPEQRAAVEKLQAQSQDAWLQAVDAGLVEGEGLPSYTPRMMANVAMASDSMAPRALNELGRNVFTRTAQMLHRGHLEAHETEAAAQELVRSRMTDQGATPEEIAAALEKVKLIRNIRVLPLATARLQEAAVWRNMINQIEAIGKATGDETVSYGTKPQGWFTIDHPSFRKWRPKMGEQADGTIGPLRDGNGNIIFEPVPIYMHPEFRGPMKAILDESSSVMKAIPGAPSAYGFMMGLKGKAMTAILNSPLIHNQVVWGKVAEAAGGREWMGLGLYLKGNRIVNGVTGRAQELIERGLNPIGKRASYQDLTGEMEAPEFGAPGRSLTAKIARMIPDLFDEARPNQTVGGLGDKVAAAIDKAGDFWHNTLLWDRVRDVHFGLADHISDKLVAKGVDRLMADRIATHFSNIIVGSIPKEAMSAGARATANMLLFSRSFTLGNLSTFKQAAFGLPKPLLAQIERDFGMPISAESLGPEAAEAIAGISKDAKSIARRKAVSTIAMSVGLFYTVNALVQHAFNVIARDSTVSDELKGYVRRWHDAVDAIKEDPFEVRHLLARLSPTWDNEPWKQDRAYVGNDSRGTGIYARIPMGKFGEEMTGYATKPMTMIRGKLSPIASGLLDVLMNDSGFGRKVYNEHDSTIRGDLNTAWAVAKHIVMKHLPEGQFAAIGDLLRGDGDKTINVARLVGPALGFTTSQGAPGGPRRGEQMEAKEDFEARFSLAWPDIKKQIQRGDIAGAQAAMRAIGVPDGMQRGLTRSAIDPASSLRGRTLLDFFQYATPEQRARFERRR